jgi:hypothetical protein
LFCWCCPLLSLYSCWAGRAHRLLGTLCRVCACGKCTTTTFQLSVSVHKHIQQYRIAPAHCKEPRIISSSCTVVTAQSLRTHQP